MAETKNNKAIHISLWVAQGLFAMLFIMAGAMKTFQPVGVLVESLPWVTSVSIELVRFIGISELLGGIGLVMPALLRIKPGLTIWAAVGLSLVMVLAAIFHGSRGEYPAIGVNLLFAAITALIAWGRAKKAPIL